ncbi:uncharacterized protein N7482_008423 [Penicillium canariense]|uniref:Uncharacterized protein n=1 Tax=Penicillium canariense TaxID=189055 RepID=A0A9W9HV72_9EURO|nr:uncharacterized protein N7482_008423 [Penicillium canariense]KAJ5157323.1 hypothetical protein N7482_008423 [Penicillium canariense]
MPPKRKSTDAAADVASKKSKASTDNAPEKPPVPRSKRWSKGISGSANADTEYRMMMTHNPESAWQFVCQCRPIVGSDDDEDVEDEGEGEGEPKKTDGLPPCDRGKTCRCTKPIEEHPDHPYTLSLGGLQKFATTSTLCSLRNPDMFDMHIYNDFYGYGLQEVLGNLLVDFEEAKDDWKQQWYICEAMTLFFLRYDPAALFMYVAFFYFPSPCRPTGFLSNVRSLFRIEDGEGLELFLHTVRTMFLAMMANLERHNLLKPDSEIKNIGMVMGLAIRLDAYAGDCEGFEDLPKYLYAYAAKHKIVLHDAPEDSNPAEPVPATGKDSLPAPTAVNDPWGFALELKKLGKEQPLGGDRYDITTLSGPERKRASLNGKDPLGKKAIKALKEGLVMQLA